MRRQTTRRPRSIDCDECGGRMHLSRCGVDDHMRPFQTRREIAEQGCNGRVYIHEVGGGIDCTTWKE